MGMLGLDNPDQLISTVIFFMGKGFALRAGKEHRALRGLGFSSQLKFMTDPDGVIFLRYMEDVGLKTNRGGLQHCRIDMKTVDLYAASNADRCPLRAIIKYMSLVSKTRTCPAFYLQPQRPFFGKAWYMNRPTGINHLCNTVHDLCVSAGLPGHYTNHSLCSTATTKLYQNNLDQQLIMEITGHRSLAVQTYKRTSQRQQKMRASAFSIDPLPIPLSSAEYEN